VVRDGGVAGAGTAGDVTKPTRARPSAGLSRCARRVKPAYWPRMKTDLDKALEIVERHGSFVGRGGTMRESIALAVAEGIALGRKEGIAGAIEALEARLKADNDA